LEVIRGSSEGGPQQQYRCRSVCPVRIAECERRGDAVGLTRLADEISKFEGSPANVRLVEHAFGEAAEEARHPRFQHLATW
jgi:hypothetical protein